MPKDDSPQVSRDYSFRHSLQPKSGAEAPILRHTQSQNYGAKKKRVKTVPPPAIPELEVADGDKGAARTSVDVVNEHVKLAVENDKKRHSRASRKNSQGVDNAGFEMEAGGRISRGNSAASSVRSSMRDPSITSVVVREQYCCCMTWTPCERALFAAVGVLAFTIILLVIAIAIVSVELSNCSCAKSDSTKAILSVFDYTKY
ncbi:uncharacterized protein LOC103314819 isoform X1 [Tribolium castaneum]|uniref:uncharacterized protein LOC103314819 isoform X1 n=1 Tax=Tribolium castaneum TaxID=7070 RepID=UPI00046BF015|nr:PREDICTED: uncharacterized protein LOC103314819 isoform X1 [Tribolium castaneum]|eukprot:XP_008200022.1 PREDICTED: uncharacterized protein LOC103314819 isoform X1 [Tribolium castaneum]